jgi:polyisoprenoid-binding protein YceI
MLGVDNLQADQFPLLIIKTGPITGKVPEMNTSLIIELHGKTFTYPIKVLFTKNLDTLQIKGNFSMKQSDFGIQPYSALGGVLAVQDEIKVTFDLIANKAL